MALSGLHTDPNYLATFVNVLRNVETISSGAFPTLPFYDTVANFNPVTIGHGINLQASDHLAVCFIG